MFKLSVIIPIYKVEKYLNQCVDSIIDKNISNIEIILVDDGSIDESSKIADLYSNNYEFIKVIHKVNGGLSNARNIGLNLATGEYIIFVDSDDWWNPDVDMNDLLELVNNNKNIEMFLFSSLDYIEGEGLFKRKEHYNLSNIRTDSIENYYSDLLNNGNLEVSAATKILKKEFIINNNLYFKEGLLSEDSEWMIRLLRVLYKVQIIDKSLYCCRNRREGSITNTVSTKSISHLLNIINYSIEYHRNNINKDRFHNNEMCYCSYLWFCALGISSYISTDDTYKLINDFKKTSVVCKYSNSSKTKLAYIVYRLFGFYITRIILGIYLELKNKTNLNKIKTSI